MLKVIATDRNVKFNEGVSKSKISLVVKGANQGHMHQEKSFQTSGREYQRLNKFVLYCCVEFVAFNKTHTS